MCSVHLMNALPQEFENHQLHGIFRYRYTTHMMSLWRKKVFLTNQKGDYVKKTIRYFKKLFAKVVPKHLVLYSHLRKGVYSNVITMLALCLLTLQERFDDKKPRKANTRSRRSNGRLGWILFHGKMYR